MPKARRFKAFKTKLNFHLSICDEADRRRLKQSVDYTILAVDGYCRVVFIIEYFSKKSEAKPIKNKSGTTVAQFLYEVICRHDASKFKLMTREFVNDVNTELEN